MRDGGASAADNILRLSGFDTAIGMRSAGSPVGTDDEPGDDPGGEPGDEPGGDTGDEPGGDTGDEPGGDTGGEPGDEPCGADIVATIGSAGTSCVLVV